MKAHIDVSLEYDVPTPCLALMQIGCAQNDHQQVQAERLAFSEDVAQTIIPGDEGIGTRTWLNLKHRLKCRYTAQINVTRTAPVLPDLNAAPLPSLPQDVVKYLLPSRYCQVDAVTDEFPTFGPAQGGELVGHFAQWCQSELTYDIAASDGTTTALDTYQSRRGVCRDYAHLLITFCRAFGIPARIASIYSPDVAPQDFHAVAEVYLQGGWVLVDPTGMTTPDRMIRIGVGRDAADVAFLTAFGTLTFVAQSVVVAEE